jgi:hypothetical protein
MNTKLVEWTMEGPFEMGYDEYYDIWADRDIVNKFSAIEGVARVYKENPYHCKIYIDPRYDKVFLEEKIKEVLNKEKE